MGHAVQVLGMGEAAVLVEPQAHQHFVRQQGAQRPLRPQEELAKTLDFCTGLNGLQQGLFLGRIEQYQILHGCRCAVFQGVDEIGQRNPKPIATTFIVISSTG